MRLFEIPLVAMSLVGLGFLAGLDTPAAHADFIFGQPVNIQSDFPLLDPAKDTITCFSADGLEMYLESNKRPGGYGDYDCWVCKRASVEESWGPPENLGPLVNSAGWDGGSFISNDGLELYFSPERPGGYGMGDLYVAKRVTRDSPWGPPTNLGANVNTPYEEAIPSVSPDGLEVYFMSQRPGGCGSWDLYVSRRATTNDPWGPALNLGPAVNSPVGDFTVRPSPDGLLLFFHSDRRGGYGGVDIWMTRRANRSAPWEPPVNLGPLVNGPFHEVGPLVTADGSALYFGRGLGGASPFAGWRAPILPRVDFNGDEIVDANDEALLTEHLGQGDLRYDIGPFPWGDGKVDASDLEVLEQYLGQEVDDPTRRAHWKLDEAKGPVPKDSVGAHDGTLVGSPLGQPSGGKVGGALPLDDIRIYNRAVKP